MRNISPEQARQSLQILIEECGYRIVDPRDGQAFVAAITVPQSDSRSNCREYRFCGALGFGGKFRNNGNHNNTPHVDCYREHETPARLAMIESANQRLVELFTSQTADQQSETAK